MAHGILARRGLHPGKTGFDEAFQWFWKNKKNI